MIQIRLVHSMSYRVRFLFLFQETVSEPYPEEDFHSAVDDEEGDVSLGADEGSRTVTAEDSGLTEGEKDAAANPEPNKHPGVTDVVRMFKYFLCYFTLMHSKPRHLLHNYISKHVHIVLFAK